MRVSAVRSRPWPLTSHAIPERPAQRWAFGVSGRAQRSTARRERMLATAGAWPHLLGGMSDPSDDLPLRASDDRFRRGRAELSEALVALLGPRGAPLPLADADRAAALAAEARGAY